MRLLVAALLSLGGLLVAMPASAAPQSCVLCEPGSVSPDPTGIDVTGHGGGAGTGDGGIPATPTGGHGANYEFEYTPACAQNRPLSSTDGFVNDIDCPGAHHCPDPATMLMYLARRTVTATTRGPWTYTGSACLGPDQLSSYDPAAAAAFALDYFQHLPLPAPGIHVQPADRALVNLPTIIYADPPPPGHWNVTHPPFPTITITGTPHWQITTDHTTISSDTPGHPYDGTDPRTTPGHYLTHTYTQPAPASSITMTITWTATFTLGDNPTPIPMNGTVTRTSTRTITIDQAGAVLTDNG